MAIPPKSTQEVVLRLYDETMQRLIVGVTDHLRDASTSQSLSQQQPPVTTSTGPAYTGQGNSGSKLWVITFFVS